MRKKPFPLVRPVARFMTQVWILLILSVTGAFAHAEVYFSDTGTTTNANVTTYSTANTGRFTFDGASSYLIGGSLGSTTTPTAIAVYPDQLHLTEALGFFFGIITDTNDFTIDDSFVDFAGGSAQFLSSDVFGSNIGGPVTDPDNGLTYQGNIAGPTLDLGEADEQRVDILSTFDVDDVTKYSGVFLDHREYVDAASFQLFINGSLALDFAGANTTSVSPFADPRAAIRTPIDLSLLVTGTNSLRLVLIDREFLAQGLGIGATGFAGFGRLGAVTIAATDDDYTPTPFSTFTGGTTPTVFSNDSLNSGPVNSGNVTVNILNDGGLTGATINADGTIEVPAATAGTYSIQYEICETAVPGNCATAIAMVALSAPPAPPTQNPTPPAAGPQMCIQPTTPSAVSSTPVSWSGLSNSGGSFTDNTGGQDIVPVTVGTAVTIAPVTDDEVAAAQGGGGQAFRFQNPGTTEAGSAIANAWRFDHPVNIRLYGGPTFGAITTAMDNQHDRFVITATDTTPGFTWVVDGLVSPATVIDISNGGQTITINAPITSNFTDSTAHLLVVGADWYVVHKWDIFGELRYLYTEETSTRERGALAGVYRHVGNNAKLGIGYEWGGVSDDVSNLDYKNSGVFLNLIAKF